MGRKRRCDLTERCHLVAYVPKEGLVSAAKERTRGLVDALLLTSVRRSGFSDEIEALTNFESWRRFPLEG